MATPIISVRQLGKQYKLGNTLQHDTLRDHITHAAKSFRNLFGRAAQNTSAKPDDSSNSSLWALEDVSFDVQPGEVVGIVGRNGAGKSTLLRVLSQITEPTRGEVRIQGRLASLLEVGTGFHPELTGRENIYLNGAILGMTKAEINRKFDEIVSFSEVEKFLDTPVKRYSSGMYMRLAFGVAANLEPEILVVDEVLAVGDVQFQKKCLGKMADVSRSGRTILFVSHNLAAVENLCTRGILIEKGRLQFDGSATDCITRYLHGAKAMQTTAAYVVDNDVLERQPIEHALRVTGMEMLGQNGKPLEHLNIGDPFTLRTHYLCKGDFAPGAVAFLIDFKSHLGQQLFRLSNMPISGYPINELGSAGYLDLTLNNLPLTGGRYSMEMIVFRPGMETLAHLTDVVSFEVSPTDVYKSGVRMAQDRGLIVVDHRWNHCITRPKPQLHSVSA